MPIGIFFFFIPSLVSFPVKTPPLTSHPGTQMCPILPSWNQLLWDPEVTFWSSVLWSSVLSSPASGLTPTQDPSMLTRGGRDQHPEPLPSARSFPLPMSPDAEMWVRPETTSGPTRQSGWDQTQDHPQPRQAGGPARHVASARSQQRVPQLTAEQQSLQTRRGAVLRTETRW